MEQLIDFSSCKGIAGVYGIKNITNNKWYVGSAGNNGRRSVSVRLREHRHFLRLGKHSNKHLQSSWNKYGEEMFAFYLLEKTANADMLWERESFWMANLKSLQDGYNISCDPRYPSVPYTEERRVKCSVAALARWNDPEYHAKMVAIGISRMSIPEYKAISSDVCKRRWADPESRAKIIAGVSRPRSEEFCRRMSDLKRGKPCYKRRGLKVSDDTKAKISAAKKGKPSAFKGRKHTNETKEKLSLARMGNTSCVGRVLSDKTKAKISAAHIGKGWTDAQRLKKQMDGPVRGQWKGVHLHQRSGKYKASFHPNGKEIYLGWFDDPAEAARNYDYHAIEYFGVGECYLNFPDYNYTGFIPKRKISWSQKTVKQNLSE